MKLTVDAQTLREAAGRAVTSKVHQITEHALLTAEGERLAMTSTDLAVTLTEWLPAEIDAAGEATCPPGLLRAALAGLDGDVSLERAERLTLRQGRRRSSFESLDPASFVSSGEDGEVREIEIDAAAFGHALDRVAYCAPEEDPRGWINGVSINGSRLVATDGFRLALAPFVSAMPDIIVPTGAIDTILGMWHDKMRCRTRTPKGAGKPNEVEFFDTHKSLRVRLLATDYTDVSPLTEAQRLTEACVTFDAGAALAAIARILPFSEHRSEKTRWHALDITRVDDRLMFSTPSAEDFCPCHGDAEIDVRLHPFYLRDALAKGRGLQTTWAYMNGDSAQRLTFLGREDAHYIMTIRR